MPGPHDPLDPPGLLSNDAHRDDAHRDDTSSDNATSDDEAFVIPIETELDLHAFRPRDVVPAAADYLGAAHERGFSDVRLVHGRGTGAQRAAIHQLLSTHPLVESFRDDPASHLGATLVHLKRHSGHRS